MNIQKEIRECVTKAEIKHSQKVTRLYIGMIQSAYLEHEMNKTAAFTIPGLKPRRLTWEGKEVFVVDAQNHLAAGFDE